MSLLRRRMMMQAEENENVIYVYNGYIGMTEDADAIPTHSTSYPRSIATSSIPVEAGDVTSVETTNKSKQERIRFYREDKTFLSFEYAYNITIPLYVGYCRFVSHGGDIGGFNRVSVTKTDGTVVNYKIVDLR